MLPDLFAAPLMQGLPENVLQAFGAQLPFPKRLGIPEEYEMVRNTYSNDDARLDAAAGKALH
jgi:hypothetical protein